MRVLVFGGVVGLLAAGYGWHRASSIRDLRLAEAALARYDVDAAATHLDQYLRHHPDDPAALFLAARTARRREHFADAQRLLERCQELGGVTDATRLEWDLVRVQQGDVTGIDARLRAAVGPDHPDALLVLEALARGYLRVERLADAIEACNLWLARQPDHPWAYLWRGVAYERLNNPDQAEADYRAAVRCAPDDLDARLALGSLLLLRRQPAAAAEQYEYRAARSPDDEATLTGLAACRVEQGRAGEAVPLLERAAARHPESARARFLRGKAALELNQPAAAVPWLREATRLAPADAEAAHLLGQALWAVHDPEAAAVTRRSDELRAEHARLRDLVRAVSATPTDPRPRHDAGVLALRLGLADEGVRYLRSALALPGDHRATHAALADHYRRVGDADRADHHRGLAVAP